MQILHSATAIEDDETTEPTPTLVSSTTVFEFSEQDFAKHIYSKMGSVVVQIEQDHIHFGSMRQREQLSAPDVLGTITSLLDGDKSLLSMSIQNYAMDLSAKIDGSVAWMYHLRLRRLAQTRSNNARSRIQLSRFFDQLSHGALAPAKTEKVHKNDLNLTELLW